MKLLYSIERTQRGSRPTENLVGRFCVENKGFDGRMTSEKIGSYLADELEHKLVEGDRT